jgi:2,3-bisphosphoglycerate-independent phosphoglycerate mutase
MHEGWCLQAKLTADLVNYVSNCFQEVLKDHPINAARAAEGKAVANVVLLRGCGVRMKLPSFQEKHGMKACIVAPTKVLGGAGCCWFSECSHSWMVQVRLVRIVR